MAARGRRLVVAGLATGLIAAAGAGIASYTGVRNTKYADGPVDCGGVSRCIPNLKPATAVEALKSQGHDCARADGRIWKCNLQAGLNQYETSFSVARNQDLIDGYQGSIRGPAGTTRGDATTSYLVWLASMPYADDPVLLSEIKAWVGQQVDGGRQAEARIGDYSYEFDASRPESVSLSITGRPPR
jgi:hypothetical protein